MKIVIASDFFYPHVNGVATFCYNLAAGLVKDGHSVLVLAPSADRHAHTEHHNGYTIRRLPSVPLRVYPLRVVLRPADEIRRTLTSFAPDVVHAQSPLEVGRNTIVEARKLGIPIVSTNHAMPDNLVDNLRVLLPLKYPIDRIMRLYGSYLHKKTDIITMPTQSAIDTMAGKYKADCLVVSNGIDTDRFTPGPAPAALRQRYNLPADMPIALYVGRLDGEKHLDVFVRALAILQPDLPVHGVIVGRGTARLQLEELARQLGISQHLTFTGFVSDEELPQIYRLGTLFAISSPAELQSIVTLEAIATGLPVVAADAVALPELCQPGVNGALFTTDDPEAMATALRQILDQPKQLRKLGEASRRIALGHSFNKTLASFEKLYAQAVAARQSATAATPTSGPQRSDKS
jgi:glycosyltransferase involved in cell wall biosynthesis